MKHLELRIYRRFFRNTSTVVDVPERYSELSAHQFHTICKLNRAELDASNFVCEFFGIQAKLWSKLSLFHQYLLADLVRSLGAQHSVSKFFDSEINMRNQTLYLTAPADMPLYQFMNADTFAQWYSYTNKDIYLVNFFLQVALPWNADYFNHSTSVTLIDVLGYLDEDPAIRPLLLDTYLNWQLIKAYLSKKYPNMFSSEEPSPGSTASPPPSNWYDVFDSLVGEHLEHIETYKRLPAFDVFRIIDSRIQNKKFKQ